MDQFIIVDIFDKDYKVKGKYRKLPEYNTKRYEYENAKNSFNKEAQATVEQISVGNMFAEKEVWTLAQLKTIHQSKFSGRKWSKY